TLHGLCLVAVRGDGPRASRGGAAPLTLQYTICHGSIRTTRALRDLGRGRRGVRGDDAGGAWRAPQLLYQKLKNSSRSMPARSTRRNGEREFNVCASENVARSRRIFDR